MSVKISQMPIALRVHDDAIIPIVQNGNSHVIHAEQLWTSHNMVGKFSDDSTPADWFWYPNGEKIAIPVNPVTGEFSYYFDGEITQPRPFNPSYQINTGMTLTKLERWDKMPPLGAGANTFMFFVDAFNSTTIPVIDCRNAVNNKALSYMFVNNSEITQAPRIVFTNTQNVRYIEMLFNLNKNHKVISITGLDLSCCTDFKSNPLSKNSAPFIELINLGKPQSIGNGNMLDCRAINWGDDSKATGARQSLVDSLLTNSFNRAAAGYNSATIQLYRIQYDRLSADEIAAIQTKGYSIAIDEEF